MNGIVAMPYILRETNAGLVRYSILEEMLMQREIMLSGEVNEETARACILQLRHLEKEDPQREIIFHINSLGGQVPSGLAIYDTMQAITCPVRTVCIGMAASMGAILFAAGDRREIYPNARVMIHDLSLGVGIQGNALYFDQVSRDLMQMRERLARILAKHTKKELDEIYKKTAAETCFTAQEAVDFGLADNIIDGRKGDTDE